MLNVDNLLLILNIIRLEENYKLTSISIKNKCLRFMELTSSRANCYAIINNIVHRIQKWQNTDQYIQNISTNVTFYWYKFIYLHTIELRISETNGTNNIIYSHA